MTAPTIRAEIDQVADLGYLQLSDEPVAKTEQFNDAINVDLDAYGMAVGIEVLSLQEELNVDSLLARYHVRSDVAAILRALSARVETSGAPHLDAPQGVAFRMESSGLIDGATILGTDRTLGSRPAANR